MEFVVYILYFDTFNKTYVGFTTALIERYKSHNQLSKKGYTTKYRLWYVLHAEFYDCKSTELQREKWFKTGVGREVIQSLKQNLLL